MRRHGSDGLVEGTRAFRDATAGAADGRATRARVLAGAGRRHLGRGERRWVLGVIAALVVVLSGAGAWTAIGRWRDAAKVSAPKAALVAPAAPARVAVNAPAAAPAIVAVPVAPPAAPSGTDGQPTEEERAYARAHTAHFGAGDPRAALAAWNAYLKSYPRGSFVPEARYNRALALLRLGRREAALEALRPFAAGVFGGYRREDATRLIEALGR